VVRGGGFRAAAAGRSVFPLRASLEDKMAGLDISLHGEAL
jgi:hypothetical protein